MTVLPEQDVYKQKVYRKAKKWFRNVCSMDTVRKRFPIIVWLPKYKSEYIIQDMIAGLTVGLTAIPQGIAFAVIAGLPPEYGLYASLTSGVVYVVFGSCYNLTVGPTTILASMIAKYVADYSPDFAILTAFLSGVFMLILGVFNLGFLVEFISIPVITGFMTSAALQIAAAQLKSLFGTKGASGNYFAESMTIFFSNIKTVQLWEAVLGFGTIIMLFLLKKLGQGCKRTDGFVKRTRWFISLLRNAVVVMVGMIIAYVIKVTLGTEPLAIIGSIGSGLPKFSWPPFSTTVGNETYNFLDMMKVLGLQSIAIPFVAILETVAIAKAFADDGRIDATQEMIAVGLCNIIGSFGQSMPITGSFARTALNHVSGVKTPAGGVTKVLLLVVALTTLTSTFYYIPKASLAGLIITALVSMIDYQIFPKIWRNSWIDFIVLLLTMAACLMSGLEYGILVGILAEAVLLLFITARPKIDVSTAKTETGDLLIIPICETLSYCAAENVRQRIIKATAVSSSIPIVIDGTAAKHMDYTGVYNLMSILDILERNHQILLLNFKHNLKKKCLNMAPRFENRFVYSNNLSELAEGLAKQ